MTRTQQSSTAAIAVGALFGLWAAGGDARGVAVDRVEINAQAYRAISPADGRTITVEAADDSALAQALRTGIEDQLRARGYRIAANSRRVLKFEFRVDRPRDAKPNIRLQGEVGSGGTRNLGVLFRVPVGKPDGPRTASYVIEAQSIDAGRTIEWVGSAQSSLALGRDRAEVLPLMSAKLIAAFGANAKAQVVPLRAVE